MSSQNNIPPEGKLLSAQERVAFRMISSGNDLHGKRAIALLSIDGGATQSEAAQQSGLTPGQVKYWLGTEISPGNRIARKSTLPDRVSAASCL